METKVYTKKIAYELRKLGFKILRVEPNPHKPEFDIYIFESTEDFESAFRKITRR